MPNLIPDSGNDPLPFLQFCSSVTTKLESQLCETPDNRSPKKSIIEANHRILKRLAKQDRCLQELNDVTVWRGLDGRPFCGLFDLDLVAPEYRAARVLFKPGFRFFHPEVKKQREQLQVELSCQNLTPSGSHSRNRIFFIIAALLSQKLFDQDFSEPAIVRLIHQNGFTKVQLETAIRTTEEFFKTNKFSALPYDGITELPAMIYLLDPGVCGQAPPESAILPSGLLQTHITFQDPLENLHQDIKGTLYNLEQDPQFLTRPLGWAKLARSTLDERQKRVYNLFWRAGWLDLKQSITGTHLRHLWLQIENSELTRAMMSKPTGSKGATWTSFGCRGNFTASL